METISDMDRAESFKDASSFATFQAIRSDGSLVQDVLAGGLQPVDDTTRKLVAIDCDEYRV